LSGDFERELLAASREPDIASNPFVRGVGEGAYQPAALRAYAAELAAIAVGFPRVLASILAHCDHPAARRALLENLLEEEGAVAFRPGDGLAIDPARRHGELARRFARAAGAGQAEAPRSTWFDRELRDGRWIGPFAYTAVGVEANVPRAFAVMVPGLRRHYGFADEDLAFLTEHLAADERHGEQGAAVVAEAATTEAARREALDGSRRGAQAWWRFHSKHDRAVRARGGG
jgi:pyrroloquinoline quinone (PQQ) biosynthesis protein C